MCSFEALGYNHQREAFNMVESTSSGVRQCNLLFKSHHYSEYFSNLTWIVPLNSRVFHRDLVTQSLFSRPSVHPGHAVDNPVKETIPLVLLG